MNVSNKLLAQLIPHSGDSELELLRELLAGPQLVRPANLRDLRHQLGHGHIKRIRPHTYQLTPMGRAWLVRAFGHRVLA